MFCKKGVLRNLAKFTGKHLCQSLFFNKVGDFRPATLLKKRLWHRCFPVNFAKFLRTTFLQNTSGRLFLSLVDWKSNFDIHVINIAKSKFLTNTVMNKWRRNKQLVILKQDKGRGVVLLDKTKYGEKCFSYTNTRKFKKLDKNPTVNYEAKIQSNLKKMKLWFMLQKYNKVYPTGSNAGKLYGTAKIHKLPELETVD